MTKDINFAKALARLEGIVEKLEGQNLDLEEAVDLLTEGVALHKKCQEKLKSAQSKIDKLLEEGVN
ncbi:exodeoxyribonuclease VII small subunit [Candidatus Curtissbacteria bacterium RIFCSPHIGHO2_01_FULL_41_44]|uniref:Exodeoxyribonuclease 7 small subunit n=1 Tax=Candidatus Curtissbacteria bacterium RIFCSPLOWO2_01_FULL_42_50 TaxID=1797730 RepID=A0A1F5H4H2_9BACT|nr:MAG: exodeoxyribonuclease VII small subunit [Candidatus Curtissbacteria bacterium RIFCSPHIGHO2_01_FULL_41_44]OGD93241.1 MAG: exodeoxyribonuclease VII small subunit [Candidatus Curtissbacteria bacterium RIFCSPHIGHO2_02_FULL_42_58]OGD96881.1 MAG: exodeoxyribonuclease VII small subunit [Candidatus Curtissbacteria bacterium RIFCSPHIGHO2_12_FULL_42_33]OGD98945.1 MAG: exodeoxyribonuclease VII small subunit [Candidatus Curtissbacteria bacterium RIFCSPLOWO2_01_FULL_42_50]OGE03489.1 MAG: exodeoxyribo